MAFSTTDWSWALFDVLGRIFIASLKLLVVPLVLVSLICGMAALGASSRMGPIAGKTLGLYLVTTCIAVTLGLAIALASDPERASMRWQALTLFQKRLRRLKKR